MITITIRSHTVIVERSNCIHTILKSYLNTADLHRTQPKTRHLLFYHSRRRRRLLLLFITPPPPPPPPSRYK